MPVPKPLGLVIEQAKNEVQSDHQGRLRLGTRQLIWNELGPREKKRNRAVIGAGLKRRVALAGSCVERVLPKWTQAFPDDQRPMEMIHLAEEYLRGQVKYAQTLNRCLDIGGDLDMLHTDHPELSTSLSAGDAAQRLLLVALNDESYTPNSIDEELHEMDLDPDDWDTAYYAAESYACTEDSLPKDEKPLRTEFWLWYLEKAVPAAWKSQKDK